METKLCKKCGKYYPLEEMEKCKKSRERGGDGRRHTCMPCKRKRHYKSKDKNPLAQKLRQRKSHLWQRYKITLADYDRMLSEQDNKCGICGKDYTINGRNLDVDHCHLTGKVRGLLCNPCNSAMGKVKDNPEILRTMYKWLTQGGYNGG
jgi:hypothetical protein